jgi:hypothetical protein
VRLEVHLENLGRAIRLDNRSGETLEKDPLVLHLCREPISGRHEDGVLFSHTSNDFIIKRYPALGCSRSE